MLLRIRDTKGVMHSISSLTGESRWSDLMKAISDILALPLEENQISLKGGFPPKAIEGTSDHTLEELGIKNGDTFVVSVTPIPNSNATTTPLTSAAVVGTNSDARSHTNASNSIRNEVAPPAGPIDGTMKRRIMEDDNSCLFSAIGYVLHNHQRHRAPSLRKDILNYLTAHPEQFPEVMLGKSHNEYCNWILNPNSWGGAIELAIFAEIYQTEIVAIDIRALRANRFGEDKNFSQCCFLIYDGIHYDALAVSPDDGLPEEFDLTIFPANNENYLNEALKLARVAHDNRQFTDVANFTLRCAICQKGLVGEKGAQEHAAMTGHVQFTEY